MMSMNAAADGLADHDDAGVAEADVEGEGKLGKRLEDGHAGVIFIAHVGVNAVEREHTERPQTLVRHDGQRPRAELAHLLPAEREQLPHGSDEYVFLKHGKQQWKEGTKIIELRNLATQDDFTEKDIEIRNKKIIDAFINYLKDNNLLK